ncbi:MAG: YoaK family protein [Rhodococcus sp. (in: high G+C Gram-positive bacteria)]
MIEAAKPTVVTSQSVRLGVLLAAVGGFVDVFTFMTRDGVFANAQTANVVLFGVDIVSGQWRTALGYLPPVVAFTLGVFTAEFVARPFVEKLVRRPVRAVLVIEILVITAVGFVPLSVPNAVVTVSISFVAALQVTTFRVLVDQAFSTTMTTGNLRSLAQAVFHRIADGDKTAGARARNFGLVITGFLGGAVFGAVMVRTLGTGAAWVAAGMLVVALGMFMYDERRGIPRVSRARRQA